MKKNIRSGYRVARSRWAVYYDTEAPAAWTVSPFIISAKGEGRLANLESRSSLGLQSPL